MRNFKLLAIFCDCTAQFVSDLVGNPNCSFCHAQAHIQLQLDTVWSLLTLTITSFSCCIRKTCPCNVYPLKPHFYIAKLGYAGVYLFFLFLLQNMDCGYSLEPPRWGGSDVCPQSMFWAKIRKISKFFLWKFSFLKPKHFLYIAWACLQFLPLIQEEQSMTICLLEACPGQRGKNK